MSDAQVLESRCQRICAVLEIPVRVERIGAAHTGAGFTVYIRHTLVLANAQYREVTAYLDGMEHGAGWIIEHTQ